MQIYFKTRSSQTIRYYQDKNNSDTIRNNGTVPKRTNSNNRHRETHSDLNTPVNAESIQIANKIKHIVQTFLRAINCAIQYNHLQS